MTRSEPGPEDAGSEPWLITVAEDGTIVAHTELVQAILAIHDAHAGIFFVPDCGLCVEHYEPHGEKW